MSAAKEVTATFSLEETGTGSCNGADILGEGSSVQRVAQEEVWIPGFQGPGGFCTGKGSEPKVTYNGPGSGAGLEAWDFIGSAPFATSRAFITTDAAPNAAQIASAEAAAGSKVQVVPVAETAISVIVHPPAGCGVSEITNQQLESVFNGTLQKWSKLTGLYDIGLEEGKAATCVNPGQITRVVRPDASGTTYQFKHYLSEINPGPLGCTEGSAGWANLQPLAAGGGPNVQWPAGGVGGCKVGTLSSVVTAGSSGGAALVSTVNATEGSFGYAALPDVEAGKGGSTHALMLQNNGKAKNASFVSPRLGASANCGGTGYLVPTAAQVGGGSGQSVDWSGVYGSNYNVGGEQYSLCELTFALALKTYSSKPGFSAGQAQTVSDYLSGYITSALGQSALAGAGHYYYAPLPSSTKAKRNVLGAAQFAAGQIGF
jgi:ABC-type phosphate transport system substrate-binding protein